MTHFKDTVGGGTRTQQRRIKLIQRRVGVGEVIPWKPGHASTRRHGESKAGFRNCFRKNHRQTPPHEGPATQLSPHRYLCLAEIPSYTRQRKENWLTNNKTSRQNIISSWTVRLAKSKESLEQPGGCCDWKPMEISQQVLAHSLSTVCSWCLSSTSGFWGFFSIFWERTHHCMWLQSGDELS